MANQGDLIVVQARKVGDSPREGEIVQVIEGDHRTSYRVRWKDGHESLYTPAAGAVRIEPRSPRKKASPRSSGNARASSKKSAAKKPTAKKPTAKKPTAKRRRP